MTAVQVNSLDTDPGRNRVNSGSTGLAAFRSRMPKSSHRQHLAVLDHDHNAPGNSPAL